MKESIANVRPYSLQIGYNDTKWVRDLSDQELKAKLVELQGLPSAKKVVERELQRRRS